MTCQEYENLMADDRREPRAERHAAVCKNCAASAARGEQLAQALRALAGEDADLSAPAAVEQRLRAEFRKRKAAAPAHRSGTAMIWRTALAVAAGLAFATVWFGRPEPRLVLPAPRPVPAPASAFAIPKVTPPRTQPVARRARTVAKAFRPARTPEALAEPAEPFVPLPYAARVSPGESLDVVRVKLPRSTIMRFGFPVEPDRVWEPVTADLVFGQDGVARAIRFVR